jgi:hypothetical protein
MSRIGDLLFDIWFVHRVIPAKAEIHVRISAQKTKGAIGSPHGFRPSPE